MAKTQPIIGPAYWACGRPKPPLCARHHKPARPCEYPLKGEKEGETCGRLCCDGCSVVINGKRTCEPHQRLIAKGKWL